VIELATLNRDSAVLQVSKEKTGFLRKETIHKVKGTVYKWAVDTTSSVTFNTPISMTNEILLSNLSFEQSLHLRTANAIISLFTSRPYGKFRDYVFMKMKTNENSGLIKKSLTNATASLIFGTPIYAVTLTFNGANKKQLVSSLAVGILLSPFLSALSGEYYDRFRKMFGMKPAYCIRRDDKDKDSEPNA
jgi:hypothetical protein